MVGDATSKVNMLIIVFDSTALHNILAKSYAANCVCIITALVVSYNPQHMMLLEGNFEESVILHNNNLVFVRANKIRDS